MHQSIRIRVLQASREEPLPRQLPRASKELLDVAQRQYEAGATLRETAKELGIGRERLALLLRDRGVRMRRATPSADEVREMARRYAGGESLERVGKHLGFSPSTVRNHLRSAGVVLRDAHGGERKRTSSIAEVGRKGACCRPTGQDGGHGTASSQR